jgi:probable rRNA maturation factor
MAIYFFAEDVPNPIPQKTLYKQFVKAIAASHAKKTGDISFIFCSDEYLYNINMEYLQHDDYTDIITFDAVEGDVLNGDIFISVERVKDNAQQLGIAPDIELQRVIAHGVLHLCGFKDKTEKDAKEMRKQEQSAIEKFTEIQEKLKTSTPKKV